MKKWLSNLLGVNKEETRLRRELDAAKAKVAGQKEKLAELKQKIDLAKPYANNPLRRSLNESKSTVLDAEQLSKLAGWEHRVSFSQNAEDIAASFYLAQEKEKGVIVDIGAYHPYRFSNTFLFHLQGWRCVSVDACQASVDLFNQIRPADINLCCLVSDREERLEFFEFAEGAWNTTNANMVSVLQERGLQETQLVAKKEKQTVPIMQLLEEHVGGNKFDLLDVDVEGMDAKLLLAIDLKIFRPKVILAEISERSVREEPMLSHLRNAGYRVRGYCGHTCLIIREDNA
jgi:FkbM family methyltransferase